MLLTVAVWAQDRITVTVPAGTPIKVRTANTLSTKTVKSGDAWSGSLVDAITRDGYVLARRGAAVRGIVANADPGGRVKGRAGLALRVTSITLANGSSQRVASSAFGTEANSTKKKDAAKIGIGAGIGAAIGAIAGGGKGAAIGAGAGGAAGTGVVLGTHGDPAVIHSESVLAFTLGSSISMEFPRRN